ncbi:MAG TPA: hypothetical protein VFM17_03665 [Candidatus Eisenbacteria bacterium]|nr:hypothetical protein [Candidatus Eisenbacteria bacterium]
MIRRLLAAAAATACLALAALLGPAAQASSVYSVGGLGEPSLEESARLRAMGGAGAGEYGPDRFSLVNPASMAGVRHLLLQGSILPTYRRVSGADASESATETIVPAIRGLVRLPGGVVLGAAYAVGTDASFRIDRAENAGTPSTLRIDGSGGLQHIRLGVARDLNSVFRVGLEHEIIAGYFREEWTRTFSDPSLSVSRDTLEARYERLGRWRIGAQGTLRGWTLGGVVETGRRLPLTYLQRAAGSTIEEDAAPLRIPAGFVAGVTGPLNGRWRVAAQYRRANWSRSSLESDLVDFRAMQRVSLGFERAGSDEPGAGFRARLPLRFGVSYLQWPDLLPIAGANDITGGAAGVNEWTFSLGTGVMTQDKGGSLDLSLEAGTRGNRDELGVNERYLRAAVTLQVSDDTWK